jgi:hypothetical protein
MSYGKIEPARAALDERGEINEDDPSAMANLPLHLTGLPMVAWASQRMGRPHDIRIEVMQTHGSRMDSGDLAVVAVRPTPRLVAGHLSPADLRAVSDWIRLNEAVLIDYWEERIYTDELLRRLQPAAVNARPAGDLSNNVKPSTIHGMVKGH